LGDTDYTLYNPPTKPPAQEEITWVKSSTSFTAENRQKRVIGKFNPLIPKNGLT
jgi:hypothetical protein